MRKQPNAVANYYPGCISAIAGVSAIENNVCFDGKGELYI